MDTSSNAETTAVAWEQLSLLDPDVTELVLRIGIVDSANHWQHQLELRDPSSGKLLAMESAPALDLANWPHHLDAVVRRLRAILSDSIEPF